MPKAKHFLYEATADSGFIGTVNVAGKFQKVRFVKGKRYICQGGTKAAVISCSGFYKNRQKRFLYSEACITQIDCKLYLKFIKTLNHESNINSQPRRPAGSPAGAVSLNSNSGKMPANWK